MEIKKIVVDELPESCKDCLFSNKDSFGYIWCKPVQNRVSKTLIGLPSWCPLQVEDECVWILSNFDGRKMYNSPESSGYHTAYLEFIFCPVCGKRIRYEEE